LRQERHLLGLVFDDGKPAMLSIAKRIVVLAAALIFSNLAMAKSAPPPHVRVQETIGAAQPQVVPSLIVFSSKGADANVLFGGSNRTIALQPLSVEGAGGHQRFLRGIRPDAGVRTVMP
jgi:hypothetical protein